MARRHWIALLFLFLIKASSYAGPFYCSDLEAVFADSSLCGSLCSSCEEMNPSSSASSGTCDTSRYRGFVYYNNKTYALTTNKGFWEDFSNLAVISDEGINSLLSSILSFYSAGSAWIGLYDPNRTQNFGVVNPDRFVWRSGSVVAYTNWKQGEPNNYVDQADIGVVPVLGEHWVEMDEGGLWNDTGYHASNGGDFAPKRYALVEWNGALDCVNGEPINADTSDYQQAIVDNVCGGDTPCYVCANDNGVYQCDAGTISINYNSPQTVSLNQYEGQIRVSASGSIDYCYNYSTDTEGCRKDGLSAVKSWIIFKGDDGKYYWLGNPDSAPVCLGNLTLQTLSYSEDGGSLVINIPSGVRLIELTDVESVSEQCTQDNRYSLSITINPAYLCPEERVQCDATNIQPYCPEGQLNPERNMCQADATITCPAGYSWDSSIDRCTMQYQCPDNGVLNKQKDRCEKAYTPVCPSDYTYDSTNQVCYKTIDCGIGSYNANTNRCEYPVTFTCPDGYTLNGTTCEYSPPSCPSGTTYSNSLDKCISNATVSCPSGYTWTGQRCETTDIICPSGFSYNSTTNRCEKDATTESSWICYVREYFCNNGPFEDPTYISCEPSKGNCEGSGFDENCNFYMYGDPIPPGEMRHFIIGGGPCHMGGIEILIFNDSYKNEISTCPSGSTLSGDKCVANPSCPSGGNFDGNADVCWVDATIDCPSGTSYDVNLDKCVTNATCSSGGSLDTVNDKCWIQAGTECPSDWSYDSTNSVCYQNVSCDYVFNPDTDRCEATVSKDCGSYTYSASEDICIQDINCPIDDSFSLSNTIKYDTQLDVCLSEAQHDCPSGPSYTYTWSSTPVNKCELVPICFSGVYNPDNDLCYVGDLSCPLGSEYQCITMEDGKNYCSRLTCGDALYAGNYTNTDTVEGANDKQADGEIDENGNCLGTIYIFNGNDYRCRPPGVQTGFSDCCKKTSTWFGLGQCKPREKILAKMRTTNKGKEYTLADARCHYVGSYCAEEWMGTCVQRKKTFCCFGSVLARILHEQGRPQIGLSWGDPKNPICRGFTPAELQSIDFGKIDFSEYENFMQDEINEKFKPQDVQQNMQDKIQDFYDNNVN
ncbi:conjugal transfer protein TraN [Persephonella sp. KM09-Lau-8]|uniref:conjugal transfer protein TraN n=1 Tax=Persephonella sp. KM09-Lau-8 TaxID=1158345 RepID=UPI0006908686|nr:conjugal transfer protein TraN [Persephonella sp. KM09-Lau-8]